MSWLHCKGYLLTHRTALAPSTLPVCCIRTLECWCAPRMLTWVISLTCLLSTCLTSFFHHAQATRMLSLAPEDAAVAHAFRQLHPEAGQAGFGFMFRSPTLWEDVAKSITLCNCGCVDPTCAVDSSLNSGRTAARHSAAGCHRPLHWHCCQLSSEPETQSWRPACTCPHHAI